MKKLVILAVLAVAGCAANTVDMQRDVFLRYQGQPIDSVMQRWGKPDRVRQEPDRFVYVWDDPIMARCRIAVHTAPDSHIIGILHKGTEQECIGMFKLLHQ